MQSCTFPLHCKSSGTGLLLARPLPWPCLHLYYAITYISDSFVYLAKESQELVVWSMGTLIMLNTLMNGLLPCLARLAFLPGCCECAEADV